VYVLTRVCVVCIDKLLLVNHFETLTKPGGSGREKVLSYCFEAVCGALYLDGGLAKVRSMYARLLFPREVRVLAPP
jgi:dsRNA-specific ribonuclease